MGTIHCSGEQDGSDRGSDLEYDYEYEDDEDSNQGNTTQNATGNNDKFVSEYYMRKKWAKKEEEIRAEKMKITDLKEKQSRAGEQISVSSLLFSRLLRSALY